MKNRMIFGIIVGTIFPIVFGLLIKFIFFSSKTMEVIMYSNILKSNFLQFGIIGNLLLFYIYKIKNKKEEQKGIVLPTLIYALIAMMLKYI